jgi:DNA-directed DNA polymerase III PolC
MDTFVHLEVRSAYSFLRGTFTPADLVNRAAELQQKAVALTDDGLHGMVDFLRAARQTAIQPIIGARIAAWDGSHITLLVRNGTGYENLCRLISISLADTMAPGKPVTKQDLRQRSEGLICLVGGYGSRFAFFTENRNKELARVSLMETAGALHDPNDCFVTLQNHLPANDSRGKPCEKALRLMRATAETASDLELPLVATIGVTFLKREDYAIHRTLTDIQRYHHHRCVDPLPNDTFYLTSGRETAQRIPFPEALANTARIAEMCAGFSVPLDELHPPRLQSPDKAFKQLAGLCLKEAGRLYNPVPVQYFRQLDKELAALEKLELADYFLLVRDVIDFARREKIRHSVRGSAAGSLIVYLLLGGVDPLAHDLLFERFINDGRGDMPDIDIDFDSERRDEVLDYVLKRFPDQAVMVATIHKFRVRSAVRLAARSLGYSLQDIKRLTTCLPLSLRGRDLNEALEKLPELRGTPLRKEEELVRVAAGLTGLPFQCSVHLGGVIISPGDIKAWTPVGRSPKGFPVGQLDKDDVEALGLLKLDLLGLRMHTAVRKALEILESTRVFVDLETMPLDDRRTYALLRSTESLGVFQVESPGQRNLLGRLQPTHFGDLIAEISLFRPGPVEGNMVDRYIRRRTGEEPSDMPDPVLIPVLEETYGVILFQEQVLRVAHVFAGLSYAEADAFRRAMTKSRGSKEIERLQGRFFEGALALGHEPEVVEQVFEQVSAFAAYGFCKAHAASFAHITYQSAYLKTHHPQAFYLGILNAGHVGSYPAYVILNEARRRGIPIFAPHVNVSELEYRPEGAGIRAPLVVVNEVGSANAARVAAERKRNGVFRSVTDFAARLPLPERVMEALALSGAFNGLDEQRWETIRRIGHG